MVFNSRFNIYCVGYCFFHLGVYLGNGVILMMGGYLSTGQGGWPSIFFFSGNIGFIWCLAYIGLGSQSPNTCFYISVYERRYIEESLPPAIRSPYVRIEYCKFS